MWHCLADSSVATDALRPGQKYVLLSSWSQGRCFCTLSQRVSPGLKRQKTYIALFIIKNFSLSSHWVTSTNGQFKCLFPCLTVWQVMNLWLLLSHGVCMLLYLLGVWESSFGPSSRSTAPPQLSAGQTNKVCEQLIKKEEKMYSCNYLK